MRSSRQITNELLLGRSKAIETKWRAVPPHLGIGTHAAQQNCSIETEKRSRQLFNEAFNRMHVGGQADRRDH